jgi:tRNA (guanine37-N1)-methyltransferase
MTFTFVTLFQNIVEGYFCDSILKRAIDKEILNINYLDPREFSSNKHFKVDDTAVGGGAGMVMNPQPLFDSLLRKMMPKD